MIEILISLKPLLLPIGLLSGLWLVANIAAYFLLKKKETRAEALLRGISITKVNRQVLMYSNNKPYRLEDYDVIRYALPRLKPGNGWEMLQRDKKSGAQLDFYLVTSTKEVTPQLLDTLRPIVEMFTEEYFEFEGTDKEVAIFWEEWGGKKQVDRVYQALQIMQNVSA